MGKLYGTHWLASYRGCSGETSKDNLIINDPNELEEIILRGLKFVNATILGSSSFSFDPQGATVSIPISESHATAHSWPEDNFLEFDFNTCNPFMDGDWLLGYIGHQIGAKEMNFSKVERYDFGNKTVEEGFVNFSQSKLEKAL